MPEIKPQRYKDDRPAEGFLRFHERSRTHDPDWIYDLVRIVTTPISLFIYRLRAIETVNVPISGPVILAANHFSDYDHFLAGAWLRRKIRFLAKSQLFGHNAVARLHLRPRRGLPDPPRSRRRGGVRDDPRHPPPRRLRDDLLRGRALALGRARRAQARRRPRRAGERRAGRPRRDPRFPGHPELAPARLPARHDPLRGPDLVPGRRGAEPRAAARVRHRDLRPRAGALRGARPRRAIDGDQARARGPGRLVRSGRATRSASRASASRRDRDPG